ncbi:MAG: monovalent cation/H(+) antiporter subunit G [Ectothiorhodospiraceae bacterium]|nr:monovalent cation/H(+) antiporter subunit G [Ectothiorhodospiraceae bacterium]
MSEFFTAFFLLVGAGFVLIGALGVVRMPDLMLRMHTTTKAGALGGGLIAVAAAFHFPETGVIVRSVAILAFVVLTAPIAAHIIGRAAYFVGVPLWEKTLKDELKERLDTKGHQLYSQKLDERADGEQTDSHGH